MHKVTISPKFQILIPKEVREALKLLPGEKMRVFLYQNRLEFIPIRKVKNMRGILKGINTKLERE